MKEAYYFGHDSNARNDEKIINLIYDLGYEGYGIFWAIIEVLHDQKDYKFQLDKAKQLAYTLRCDIAVLQKIVNDFGLFERDDKFFWSESLLRRMREKEARQFKAKNAANTKWDKVKSKNDAPALHTHEDSIENNDSEQEISNAKNMQPHNSGNTKNMQPHEFSNAKPMPFKGNIEMKGKENITTTTTTREADFEIFEFFKENAPENCNHEKEAIRFIEMNELKDWKVAGGRQNWRAVAGLYISRIGEKSKETVIEKTININNNGKKRVGTTESLRSW